VNAICSAVYRDFFMSSSPISRTREVSLVQFQSVVEDYDEVKTAAAA